MINYQAIEQPNSRHEELTIAKLKKGPVPGNTTRNWTLEMDVPEANVYDVDGCHFINIEYEFVVRLCDKLFFVGLFCNFPISYEIARN